MFKPVCLKKYGVEIRASEGCSRLFLDAFDSTGVSGQQFETPPPPESERTAQCTLIQMYTFGSSRGDNRNNSFGNLNEIVIVYFNRLTGFE